MREQARTEIENPRIDYGIIFSVMMLALIGLASIYVAAVHDKSSVNVTKMVAVQLLWYVVGIGIILIVMQFDTEQLWKIAPYAYGLGIFLMFVILFLYSRAYYVQTGAKSWFAIGPFTFQPSEVMKPAFILMAARVVMTHNTHHHVHDVKNDFILIGKLVLWTLPIIISLHFQNDLGTTLVFLAILAGIILVSGITWKILVPVFTGAAVIGTSAIVLVATDGGRSLLEKIGFHAYQFARIDTWLHPANDTSNNGYQLWQSMKAIGSGQVFGKGFNVSQVYVPVRESDMIFSVIGENFGFIGATILILLYFLLIYQMIRVTFDTKNEFYAYISTGVIMMVLFHVFENIGMNIGLLPLTGIPLPFISQGGSSLIGNLIGVGLIMSMRFHYKSYMFSADSESFH
ncbi:FtsW/RodA/SpoVE family cell cycle protein [Loigolactobacillus bifermentans]|uniref:Cell division membrane protein n=1 Tax=Loigolactobacillus bifermentans DSM 20003 TaxID=1423726 RepID=A0A0R1GZ41_9LACO|nr:FtsW/RodA/SpoVE family cell cycle protein [Loigolactobacillus bifermentans]KRK39017.1 cell division membrane protein [Loigolactobacillus bifermentans DSM 20003]QGG59094.1 rod shape-determining protein RodA [Loigolactobacillus bifermentans]